MDTLIQDKVSQKANELTATYDEKFRNYDERYYLYQLEPSFDHLYYAESKTYNVKSRSPKTNYGIYVFPTKTTRRNCSTTV